MSGKSSYCRVGVCICLLSGQNFRSIPPFVEINSVGWSKSHTISWIIAILKVDRIIQDHGKSTPYRKYKLTLIELVQCSCNAQWSEDLMAYSAIFESGI